MLLAQIVSFFYNVCVYVFARLYSIYASCEHEPAHVVHVGDAITITITNAIMMHDIVKNETNRQAIKRQSIKGGKSKGYSGASGFVRL